MKKSVKKKWVAALNSGKYKQTTGALKNDNGFCCLGVLCDVYRKEKKKKLWETTDDGTCLMFSNGGTLPYKVQEWSGIKVRNPKTSVKKGGNRQTLADLNDIYKFNFKEIAKVIKRDF